MSSLSRASGRVSSLMWPRSHLCTSLLQYSSSAQDGMTDENKIHLVDTLALVKRLEYQGLPINQAEAITANIVEFANNSLKYSTRLFVSKTRFDKFEVVQDSTLSQFMSEMKNMQDNNLTSLKREIEKVNENIDKMDHNLTSKFEKMEFGFASKFGKMENDFASRFDKEIPAMKEQLQNLKFETTKYLLGIFASIGTVCLGILYVGG